MDVQPQKLENYFALLAKVDELYLRITHDLAGSISCREGCDSCCRHLTLFPVEGAALALALRQSPPQLRRKVLSKARAALPDGPCPLLDDRRCLLYGARPIICRTHGLPILTVEQTAKRIDYCPLNFTEMQSFPGNLVINLETLNSALAVVSANFTATCPYPEGRVSVANALLSASNILNT